MYVCMYSTACHHRQRGAYVGDVVEGEEVCAYIRLFHVRGGLCVERQRGPCVCACVYIYIYMYTWVLIFGP